MEIYAGSTPGGVDGREGVLIRAWSGDIESGAYRMRWIFTDTQALTEARDYPLTVTDSR
jgi:hypothetical protein